MHTKTAAYTDCRYGLLFFVISVLIRLERTGEFVLARITLLAHVLSSRIPARTGFLFRKK
ncbi:hypothetical protein [Paenibacillus apiarius]|uniref:hypothetical protein n=1 Tax=Paenibacillus apiarius TaxID=46240 RepID=UPI003B3A979D